MKFLVFTITNLTNEKFYTQFYFKTRIKVRKSGRGAYTGWGLGLLALSRNFY